MTLYTERQFHATYAVVHITQIIVCNLYKYRFFYDWIMLDYLPFKYENSVCFFCGTCEILEEIDDSTKVKKVFLISLYGGIQL